MKKAIAISERSGDQKTIFIGGFGNSGTTITYKTLLSGGFQNLKNGPELNSHFDYGSGSFGLAFKKYMNGDQAELKEMLDIAGTIPGQIIKHGHLMLMVDTLREWYPKSTYIYVMRNPIDCAMSEQFYWHYEYGNIALDDMRGKIQYYIDQSVKQLEIADYVIRLEDLVNNSEKTISKLFDFVGAPPMSQDRLDEFINTIYMPASLGAGKEYYKDFDASKLGY